MSDKKAFKLHPSVDSSKGCLLAHSGREIYYVVQLLKDKLDRREETHSRERKRGEEERRRSKRERIEIIQYHNFQSVYADSAVRVIDDLLFASSYMWIGRKDKDHEGSSDHQPLITRLCYDCRYYGGGPTKSAAASYWKDVVEKPKSRAGNDMFELNTFALGDKNIYFCDFQLAQA